MAPERIEGKYVAFVTDLLSDLATNKPMAAKRIPDISVFNAVEKVIEEGRATYETFGVTKEQFEAGKRQYAIIQIKFWLQDQGTLRSKMFSTPDPKSEYYRLQLLINTFKITPEEIEAELNRKSGNKGD